MRQDDDVLRYYWVVSKVQPYPWGGILPLLLLSNIRNRYQPASKLLSSLLHGPIGVVLGYSERGILP